MAQKTDPSLEAKLQKLQDQEGMLDPQPQDNSKYRPNKRRRAIRRQVYARWYWLKTEGLRAEAEADWDIADKEYSMFIPEIDPNDWQSHLQLPDAFAAIQGQMQETVERKARPSLSATDDSKQPLQDFANGVMNYNMNNTGYDYQYFMAKLSAASRGTAFLMDYWRHDTRIVKDPVKIDETTGEIVYKDKELVDFDDDYTEWVPNEFIYIDEKAKHIDEAVDMFRREILNIEEFHRIYGNKPGFYDSEFVTAGGDRSTRSFFKTPGDVTNQDVEILHYYNRAIDAYWCVANNITIYDSPLPWKHKELPVSVLYQYRVAGRFWGLGIPKVIHFLSEERKSIRNLNMDRQKIIVGGAFMHNSSFTIKDEDTILYPGKILTVDTNSQPLGSALAPIPMGDVSPSYFKTEEILLEDIRRAHGIDDRVANANTGGTATQAAIIKESALKRVNLISIANEMDTVIRIGKLKWSNIQFFYGTPRLEAISEEEPEKQKKVYRTISVKGKKFSIQDDNGSKVLRSEDVKGGSAVELKPEYAKFLEGNFDVSVDADIFTPISKAIEQTKKTELFGVFINNPATLAVTDIIGAASDVLQVNGIKADKWLKNPDGDKYDQMMLADAENQVMMAGQPLSGTKDATTDHTLVHILFTNSPQYQAANQVNKQLLQDHIMQEHDANPATGSSADLMGAYGLGAQPGQGGASDTPSGPQPGQTAPLAINAQTTQPQAQIADLQPMNSAPK